MLVDKIVVLCFQILIHKTTEDTEQNNSVSLCSLRLKIATTHNVTITIKHKFYIELKHAMELKVGL